MTLPELLIVIAVAAMMLTVGVLTTVPWFARETMQSSLHNAGTMVQLARTEAVQRNRPCRFVVDLGARTMSVVDTNGTVTKTDDVVLRFVSMPSVVSVARPDPGSPITFDYSGAEYFVEFGSDGGVVTGSGEMVLYGGERYDRMLVYTAGGVKYERWDGASWKGLS